MPNRHRSAASRSSRHSSDALPSAAAAFDIIPVVSGVRVTDGLIEFTRIPTGPSSTAAARVRCRF